MISLRRHAPLLALLPLAAATTAAPSSAAAPSETGPAPYRIVWDDFHDGFETSGPDARWSYLKVDPFVADDGVVSTSHRGLRVDSRGTNPATGDPAFVRTVAQEDDNGTGLPGAFDHMKWLAYTNHTASSGFPGFDAVPGQELSCETWMSGRTHGTEGHPFGTAVTDPDDDLRLASVGMPVIDQETLMVFDFFVSNERVYAFYERLPYAREELGPSSTRWT